MHCKSNRFTFEALDAWPPLAWIAVCSAGDEPVVVRHGKGVETHDEWFAEAVWDDSFEEANFDRTDLVFGSGARIRDGGVTFVSSATMVDRLHHARVGGKVYVSNSLACLLANLESPLWPVPQNYFRFFESVIRGIENYKTTLDTNAQPVELTYYHNLRWNGRQLTRTEKPWVDRKFDSFETYYGFMVESLKRLAANMRSTLRREPLDLLATVSTGYDSPTVVALAREAGLRETISFASARGGQADSGAEIARRLGLEPHLISRDAWQEEPLGEIPFLASDAKGEDVYFAAAKPILKNRLLLTGYGGTLVWGMSPKETRSLPRSDQSGLSHTEHRLWAGYLHCPVTFIGARQSHYLQGIARSKAMSAWDVGGEYNRPVCRRIVEQAGVPREMFGISKKAASVLFWDGRSFLSDASLDDYRHWLDTTARPKVNTSPSPLDRTARRFAGATLSAARLSGQLTNIPLLKRIGNSWRLTQFANYQPLFGNLFPWALEKAIARYSDSRSTALTIQEDLCHA